MARRREPVYVTEQEEEEEEEEGGGRRNASGHGLYKGCDNTGLQGSRRMGVNNEQLESALGVI